MAIDLSKDPYMGRVRQEGPDSFTADKTIVTNLSVARNIYIKLRTNHLKRIALYAEIDGLIQGNPPYNPEELRSAGLQHIANFNDMSAKAVIERAALAYWNLLNNSVYLTRFVLRSKDPQAAYYAEVMSKNWDFAVKTYWPSFIVNVASLGSQLVKLGVSPVLFSDERDPRWRVVELSRFLIPDQAQSDLDLLTTVCVETEFTVQYLWETFQEYKNKEQPKDKQGWNTKQLGQLLVQLSTLGMKEPLNPMDYAEMERKLYSGDISFDRMYNDTVRLVSLLQKEYAGKFSHYIFHRYYGNSPDLSNTEEDFLFFQQGQFEDLREGIIIFTMNPGEYTIHANRGIGHKIFSLAQAKIMMDCSVVDMAKWAATPILKSSSLATKDSDQIRFYPGVPTNIGTAEFVQNNLGANVQNVVSVAQYLQNLIQYNITYSGSDPASPDPDTGSISPSQMRLMAFREFSVLKNNIMHFYSTFDRVLQNMTARMLRSKEGYPGHEIAKVWKERCLEDGVPEEVFDFSESDTPRWMMPSNIEVYATRAAGAGSQVAHLIGLQELQAIMGSFGPRETKEYKRQFIMATVGPEYVSAFQQESDDADEFAGGSSLAGVENAVMQSGKSPIFSPDNDHQSHVEVHMTLMNDVIQRLQKQQMDIVEADSILSMAVPHTADHMQVLAASPFSKDFYAKMKPLFDQVSRYAALVRKNAATAVQANIKEQQEAQANQQQTMNEEELKNLTTMNDEKRKDIKLNAQLQRQERQGAVKEAALLRKTQGDLQIKATQVKGDLEIKKRATEKEEKDAFENTSLRDSEESPSDYLRKINGSTPNPYDLE